MDRYFYRIYGLTVVSDFRLDEAESIAEPESPDVTIRQAFFSEEIISEEVQQKFSDDVRCFETIGMQWSRMIYSEVGVFHSAGGNLIEYQLLDGYKCTTASQIILSWCFSTLFIQRRELAIHGSAVIYNGKMMLISGESGSGKSTLTAEYLSHGARFMSDDIVRIVLDDQGRLVGCPAYPQRKLCPDAVKQYQIDQNDLIEMYDTVKEKYAVRNKEQYHDHPEIIDAMIVIEKKETEKVSAVEVQGGDKLKLIMQNLFNLDAYKQCNLNTVVFTQCLKLAQQIRIICVQRPVNGITVSEQISCIETVL